MNFDLSLQTDTTEVLIEGQGACSHEWLPARYDRKPPLVSVGVLYLTRLYCAHCGELRKIRVPRK